MQIPESILIIKMSAIGDVVHTLPFLEILRENFPKARIDWLMEEEASQIIEGHPALDRVIVSRRKQWQRGILKGGTCRRVMREAWEFLKEVRARRYDLVIDLQGLFRSGLLTGISRGRRKIGMTGAREGAWIFLNERPVPVDHDEHAIDRYLRMARYLECRTGPCKAIIPVFESDRERVRGLLGRELREDRPLVALNPVARWETKLWLPDRFAVLADRLARELSCTVAFTGSAHDRETIELISGMMESRPLNLAGRTGLKELAFLYSLCALLVTTDTGPMHIAAAMGCPVVALFGPTAPWRTGPYGNEHRIVRVEMDCSPCLRKRCDEPACMQQITVEMVLDAARKILENDTSAGEQAGRAVE
jgi:lipopolysaccharide heptosyltransferase I